MTRGAGHPPLVTEFVDLGNCISVGYEMQGQRKHDRARPVRYGAGWLTSLRLDLLVWRDPRPDEAVPPRQEDAQRGGVALDAYIAERLATLAIAAPHFATGAWGERAATDLGNRLAEPWYGIRSQPDHLLKAETGIRSYLTGRPSFRSAGLSFSVDGATAYGELVDLIRWLHKTIISTQPAAPGPLYGDTILPDWDLAWMPRSARRAS